MDKNNLERLAFKYILEVELPKLQKKDINLSLDFKKNHVVTNDGIQCSGFFDNNRKVLACAVGTKKIEDWFTTFLHEMSHFDQYSENSLAWQKSVSGDKNSDDLLEMFLKGKELDNIEEVIKNICFLEYDCEMRTTEKLKTLTGFIDLDVYIQKSNAYIAYYKQMFNRKKWYDPKKAPYLNEDIYLNMPKTFLSFDKYFENYHFNDIRWEKCF